MSLAYTQLSINHRKKTRARWSYFIALMVVLFLLSGCAAPSPPTTLQEETKQVVTVEVQGTALHYQGESFWTEDRFSLILENQEGFASDLIEDFTNNVSSYGEGNEQVTNATVVVNEDTKSTILKCDVYGAIWKSGNRYQATFFWLLKPLDLDFINNDFDESEEGLSWQGLVNDIPTSVIVELPAEFGHCHAHAWWEFPSGG